MPVLAETFRRVASVRIRHMATIGGALAHADPNQDPPVTLLALGARVEIRGAAGRREQPLEEFFRDYYETTLEPGELVTAVIVPPLPAASGSSFLKFLPRTADDYATVAVSAVVTLEPDGGAMPPGADRARLGRRDAAARPPGRGDARRTVAYERPDRGRG